MKPKIVTKESFKVIGMERKFTLNNNTIPQLWDDFMPRFHEIKNKVNPDVAYGICESGDVDVTIENMSKDTEFNEVVCFEVSNFDDVPDGMVTRTIPAHKYAMFTHKGELSNLSHTYDYIFGEWLTKSGYDIADNFDFELYDERFNLKDQKNSEIDVYLPIKEK
ncbi:MAG: GyrI-like domain-containing protein [Candidatus Eremiobacteraeota bacterium]|nr:GyrI-like domain-containing protein [Candidatus Eremiobacteraeota bacterium]